MVNEDLSLSHPTDDELAAYLGHELEGEMLRRVELHLARCATCREEVVDARDILRTPRRVRWPVLAPVAAAAAVALLFISWPRNTDLPTGQPVHRETPSELGVAPVPVSPVGAAGDVRALVWRRVPGADRYRLTLYGAEGSVLWRATTADSLILLPDSVAFQAGELYLWRVEARVGWDVWESSDLTEFRLEGIGSLVPDQDVSR
jgi:hypothetical protein